MLHNWFGFSNRQAVSDPNWRKLEHSRPVPILYFMALGYGNSRRNEESSVNDVSIV